MGNKNKNKNVCLILTNWFYLEYYTDATRGLYRVLSAKLIKLAHAPSYSIFKQYKV